MRKMLRRTALAMVAALMLVNVGSAFAQFPPNASEPQPSAAPKGVTATADTMEELKKDVCGPGKAGECPTKCDDRFNALIKAWAKDNAGKLGGGSSFSFKRDLIVLLNRDGEAAQQLRDALGIKIPPPPSGPLVIDENTANQLWPFILKRVQLLVDNGKQFTDAETKKIRDLLRQMGEDKDGNAFSVEMEFTPAMQRFLDAKVKERLDALPKPEPIKQSAGDFLTREQAERMLASAGYIPKRWNFDVFAGFHLGFNEDYNSRSGGRPAGIYKGVKPAGLFGAAIRIRVGWRAEIDFGVEGGPTQHDDLAAYVGGRVGLLFRVLSDDDDDEKAHGQLRLGVRGIASTTFVPGASREPWRSTDGSIRGVIWYTFPGTSGLGITVEPGYRSGEMKYYLNNAIQIDKFHDFSLAAAVVWSKTL